MPHSPQEKKRAMTRIRRIRGQAEALERALDQGEPCATILQQIAAMRGAVNSLMAEILQSHLREEFGLSRRDSVDDAMALIRSYLK